MWKLIKLNSLTNSRAKTNSHPNTLLNPVNLQYIENQEKMANILHCK